MNAFIIVLVLFIGYIIGSIPNALIIGKTIFKKDILHCGTRTLDENNVFKIFGTITGIIVTILEFIKPILYMLVLRHLNVSTDAIALGGLSVCFGHCFPVFAEFKGGKALSISFGYLFGLGIFVINDIVFIFIYPVLIFFLMLGLCRYISISTIITSITSTIIAFITFKEKIYAYLLLILTLLVIYQHRSNIYKIITKKEERVKFLK